MRNDWHTPTPSLLVQIGLYALLYGVCLWTLFNGEEKFWWDYVLAYAAILVATLTAVVKYAFHSRDESRGDKRSRHAEEEGAV